MQIIIPTIFSALCTKVTNLCDHSRKGVFYANIDIQDQSEDLWIFKVKSNNRHEYCYWVLKVTDL